MSVKPATLNSVQLAAAQYINRGWQVVPLGAGTKAPQSTAWLRLIFKPEDFKPTDNIGIRSVNGLVDVDCDAPEVVLVASAFLPLTGAIYGRPSKPKAHWLYMCGLEKPVVFKDLGAINDKATLIEIRVNHQSMAPPSRHPDGEEIRWEGALSDVISLEPEALLRSVRLTATCALVARYYNPPGDRHDWGLALSGTLYRFGLTEDETSKIFLNAAKTAGDKEIKDRLDAVKSTFNRDDDDPMKAAAALKKAMGDRGQAFINSLRKVWGSASSAFITDDKNHRPVANPENIRRALMKLDVTLSFDDFSQKPLVRYAEYEGVLQDAHVNRLWLQIDEKFGFRPGLELFDTVVQDSAWRNKIHPVKDYLEKLTWDGVPRIDRWLITYGGATDDARTLPYVTSIGKISLIAAVRRVMQPGCKYDEILVLEAEQGKGKSSAIKILCPNESWFSDDLPLNVDAKQIIERTRGKWIIEAAELSGIHSSQNEHLKALLSRSVDGPVRMAYARLAVEQPRQFIVIGSTNSHHYLSDSTGNRRFWPIRVVDFDINALRQDRDQLWAEAVVREKRGESIRLDPSVYGLARVQQERRRHEDPWQQKLEDEFPRDEPVRVTYDKIWMTLGIPTERRSPSYLRRVVEIMQFLGFRKMTVRDEDNKVVKGWGRNTPGMDEGDRKKPLLHLDAEFPTPGDGDAS